MINLVEVGMGAGQVLAKLGVCDTARGPVHLGNQISQSKMGNMEFVSYSLFDFKDLDYNQINLAGLGWACSN